jgi:pimeloyl-ACP methyl ester carboxylesterase
MAPIASNSSNLIAFWLVHGRASLLLRRPKKMNLGPLKVILIFGITFLVVSITALYITNEQVHRWLNFYIWRSIAVNTQRQYVRVNGVRLYYETYGRGAPVLVLHGGLGSIEGMAYQIRALASSHFVIALDSRGHGRSTDSDEPLSYSLMSDDSLQLMDHLKLHRVDVVGWSDGAIIGLDLAIRHPDRIKRLVAISGNFDVEGLTESSNDTHPRDAQVPPVPLRYRILAPDSAHWPAIYRKVVAMWHTQPHYTLNDLRQIEAPTVVMAGEFDIIKREHTDQLAKAIAKSEEIIVEGAGHNVPVEKPEIVNSAILQFLGD